MRGWPHCKCPSGDVTTCWWRFVRGPRPTQGRFWCPSIYVLLPFSKGRCLRPLGTSHGFANPTAPYCKNLPPVSASMEGDRNRASVLLLPNRPRRQAAWRIRLTARSVPDTRAQGALRRFGSSSSGRGSTGALSPSALSRQRWDCSRGRTLLAGPLAISGTHKRGAAFVTRGREANRCFAWRWGIPGAPSRWGEGARGRAKFGMVQKRGSGTVVRSPPSGRSGNGA